MRLLRLFVNWNVFLTVGLVGGLLVQLFYYVSGVLDLLFNRDGKDLAGLKGDHFFWEKLP